MRTSPVQKTGLMGERELVCRRKDGTEFPAEISLSPIETEEGLLIAAAVREVSQRKRLELEIRSNLEIQSTLTALLELSLEPLTLEQQLERTLDLLTAVPWIELESKGAIFLAEEGSEELVMKAQRGLSASLIAGCGRLPFGRCLCGRAATTRQIVFASCADERHDVRYPGMAPHGHYCVPIVSGDELIGVINLYLKHGHRKTPEEERFLAAVANVLAGIVKRKRVEESLRKSEERFRACRQGHRRRHLGLGPPDQPGLLLPLMETDARVRGTRDRERLHRMGESSSPRRPRTRVGHRSATIWRAKPRTMNWSTACGIRTARTDGFSPAAPSCGTSTGNRIGWSARTSI